MEIVSFLFGLLLVIQAYFIVHFFFIALIFFALFGNNIGQLMAKSIGLRDARDRSGKFKDDSYYIIVNNILFSKLATGNGFLGGAMVFFRICQLLAFLFIFVFFTPVWAVLMLLIILITSVFYHIVNTVLIYFYTRRFYKEKAVLYALFNFLFFSIPGAYIIASLSERVTKEAFE